MYSCGRHGMEEVVGSIPTRSTKLPKCSRLTRSFAGAQDFASGLRRPLNGSSSIPIRSTNYFNSLPNPRPLLRSLPTQVSTQCALKIEDNLTNEELYMEVWKEPMVKVSARY